MIYLRINNPIIFLIMFYLLNKAAMASVIIQFLLFDFYIEVYGDFVII